MKISSDEREMAVKAVKALGLQVAGVDILRAHDGPKVIEVNASPGLQGIETTSKKDLADLIIRHLERKVHLRPPAEAPAIAAE